MKKDDNKEINIPAILQDYEQVTQAIQTGIRAALLQHKRAGNPVCGWKDGQVVWVAPENIPVDNQSDAANK